MTRTKTSEQGLLRAFLDEARDLRISSMHGCWGQNNPCADAQGHNELAILLGELDKNA